MAKKRANGEGTIYKKKNGRYEGQITVGTDPITGKLKIKSFSGKTKKEVLEKIDLYKANVLFGTYIEPNKITFGQWLRIWLTNYYKHSVTAKTFDEVETMVNNHILPSLEHIKLQQLNSDTIENFYREKLANGRLDGKGGLSRRSVEMMHIIINLSLKKAIEKEYILKNPIPKFNIPMPTSENLKCLTLDEYTKVIKSVDNYRYGIAILFGLGTGVRMGELIALTWDDIDLKEGIITINKAVSRVRDRNTDNEHKYKIIVKGPKNQSSNRSIPIPKSLIPKLKTHKLNLIEERLAAGESYQDNNLVFPTKKGNHVTAQGLQTTWKSILENAGVSYVNFHSIRHSYATRLLEKGENVKIISDLLGHSNITTTLNTYSHVLMDTKKSSVDRINDLFTNNNPDKIKEADANYK